ncbi:hypothetical protein P8452_17249 [Trifolium repens]|nr:hypothetical protein P8452_17249 [Trifolium repens]
MNHLLRLRGLAELEFSSRGTVIARVIALCIDTPTGEEVLALKEIGVLDSVGSFKKLSLQLNWSEKEKSTL